MEKVVHYATLRSIVHRMMNYKTVSQQVPFEPQREGLIHSLLYNVIYISFVFSRERMSFLFI